jgi:hypothetical protein
MDPRQVGAGMLQWTARQQNEALLPNRPSALSSLLCCSGTTRNCKRVPTALQENTADRFVIETVAFYLGHTPGLQRLKHVDDHSTHRLATPAATDLPALVAVFTQRVTSLASSGTPLSYVRPSGAA